jgi:hypothetical protein
VHKTANVLNKLPKSQQSKAKRALQEISMAETRKDALLAFDAFIETWGVKYDRAWSGRALQEGFVDLARMCGLASMYPASDWSVLCSEPSWISARVRSY